MNICLPVGRPYFLYLTVEHDCYATIVYGTLQPMHGTRPSATVSLGRAQRLDWLRLIRCENVGPRTFFRLIELYGDPGAALAALPTLAKKGGRTRPIVVCEAGQAEREMALGESLGATLMTAADLAYPRALAAIDDAPPVIWVRGDPTLLSRPMVAMVGARNASLNGRNIARRMAADLGRQGLVVVSGLARGIDTAAHEGALAAGTVAVVAGGVDVIYPPENDRLYQDIVAAGAVISEMPPGTQPQASHFPRRNRLVSGLSLGVVVVEASPKSGSLITARFALEQGRDVFAVPGSPLDPRAQGPNDLLRHGAILVENAQDVIGPLHPHLTRTVEEKKPPPRPAAPPGAVDENILERARQPVLDCLGYAPTAVDDVLRQCPHPPGAVLTVLLELELAGRIERLAGNRISLVTDALG
jgi:DNA processing protein